jgi:peroxiredoxin
MDLRCCGLVRGQPGLTRLVVSGAVLGGVAFAAVAAAGASWMRGMARVQLPQDARAHLAACATGVVLGAAALMSAPGLLFGSLATLALLGGGAFLALYAASGQRTGTIRVAVGEPALEFSARDDSGERFALAALRGRPVLLKFFRGHWCPYCVAELKRWRELASELARRDVVVVTVCSEDAPAIRAGRVKHGLDAIMLPDPELAITDLYGLRNPRNFAPKPGLILPLPIPTTILIDADGIVRWIDQSTDYMRRSDPEIVRTALTLLDTAATRRAS